MDHQVDQKGSYQHGGTALVDFKRLGVAERPVLDFSVNLNPMGPPGIIRDHWPDLLETIEPYPSLEGDGIGHYYSRRFGIPQENFLGGNGSTEMIYLVPRVFGFKRALVITPSYHDYERASRLAGAEVVPYPLSPDKDFAYPSVDQLTRALNGCDALCLGRPNNPTGTLFPKAGLVELATRLPDTWFVVDEAFIQFMEGWEAETLLREPLRPNILVIHSLTKFFALAGIRMGGVAGAEAAISRLRQAKEPWTVNRPAEKIAPLLVGCQDYEQESRRRVATLRDQVVGRLGSTSGIRLFPSQVNFILCQWRGTENLDDLIRALLREGMYIRDCRNFPGLEANYFRVGFRSPQETDRLLSLLASL
jgi:L-threonine-O-3-phosphate decarboxylase